MADLHPCLTCGACCASFRVDFSVWEHEDHGGRVPAGLAVEVTDSHNGSGKRMVTAWSGNVTFSGTPAGGEAVSLQVYRKADDAADTINSIDVQLVAVELLISVSAADDS